MFIAEAEASARVEEEDVIIGPLPVTQQAKVLHYMMNANCKMSDLMRECWYDPQLMKCLIVSNAEAMARLPTSVINRV